jgi:DNA-binding MarR family transcriptional regulator
MTSHLPDPNSKKPLPLQQTVRRMVESLANASLGTAAPVPGHPPSTIAQPEITPDVIRAIIRARQARDGYLPLELLSDPAWGMLLELLHGELAGQRVSMSTLCEAAAVPDSTAVRWLKALEANDLAVRRSDPHEGGSEFVELTRKGSAALRGYFRDILANP